MNHPTLSLFFMAKVHNLEMDPLMSKDKNNLSAIFNGCGPESLPNFARKFLDRYFSLFAPAFLVHDWDYAKLEKTKENFKISNKRLYKNMKILVKNRCKWYTSWYFYFESWRLYGACKTFGWSAFKKG